MFRCRSAQPQPAPGPAPTAFLTMLSKRGRDGHDIPEDHTKRLRSNVADLFLMSQVSAERAQSLAADATFAGASNVADLARSGQAGRCKGSIHRDML